MEFIQPLFGAIQGALAQGVLWGIMTLGVYITFRVLDFPDLTVDGSFATGGVISAVMIANGANVWLSLLVAALGGMACGFITGFLHTKLKIPGILAGILTMLALYSINLHISNGSSNLPLLGVETLFTKAFALVPGVSAYLVSLIIGLVITGCVIALLYWLFGTEVGSAIRATGNNEYMVRALGANTDTMKIIGLVLSNGLVALSGGLVAQNQGYADVGMGTGSIMIGLASVIIGEVIMGNRFSFAYKLISVVVGSVIYRIIIAVVLYFGFKATDLKLLTSIVVAVALAIPVVKKRFFSKPKASADGEELE